MKDREIPESIAAFRAKMSGNQITPGTINNAQKISSTSMKKGSAKPTTAQKSTTASLSATFMLAGMGASAGYDASMFEKRQYKSMGMLTPKLSTTAPASKYPEIHFVPATHLPSKSSPHMDCVMSSCTSAPKPQKPNAPATAQKKPTAACEATMERRMPCWFAMLFRTVPSTSVGPKLKSITERAGKIWNRSKSRSLMKSVPSERPATRACALPKMIMQR
mmetsp:Transcript_44749/g.124516  ORF Transcript_44749/g.124516 Transcript_44749/m.124516 type:complete len:220 (-) Transcript_44749:40-699(-)